MPVRSVAFALAASILLHGCSAPSRRHADASTGGDASRGAVAIARYGCGSCHMIKGIAGANGLVGPPLTGIGDRLYVAGVLPNTTPNMMRWVRHPSQVDEKTVMPDLGVTEQDARDMTAYLYSLP
jgi:cytochrome c2